MNESALHNAPCLCFEFDDTGTLTYVNTVMCDHLGYTSAEMINKHVEAFFPVSTKIFYSTHFFPMLKLHGEVNEIFFFLKNRNDEQVPLLLNAKRYITDQPKNICAGIVVPNRKKFEEELINARNRMEDAIKENSELIKARAELADYSRQLDATLNTLSSQNDELKQFNKVVTHDLQEPIRKLFFYSDVLKDQLQFDRESQITFTKIVESSERLRHVLKGLQEYVWLTEHTLQKEAVNLNEVLAEEIEALEQVQDKSRYSVTRVDLPTVFGDGSMLRRLFYFILENSVRFSKPGIKNHISITSVILKKNTFTAIDNKYEFADYLKVSITDTGMGFDPVFKSEAFDLFKKLHNNEGRGLGLTLSKKIMTMHDGFIEAESKRDEGTRISLFFPAERVIGS